MFISLDIIINRLRSEDKKIGHFKLSLFCFEKTFMRTSCGNEKNKARGTTKVVRKIKVFGLFRRNLRFDFVYFFEFSNS